MNIILIRPIADIQEWPEVIAVPEGVDPHVLKERILSEAVYPIEVQITTTTEWKAPVHELSRALLPGVFDLRRELGRAPTEAEFRATRGRWP